MALEHVHKALWSHMQSLILAVAIGDVSSHHVSTVEGLLLLAEWVPHYGIAQTSTTSERSTTKSYFEDSAAWTLVGLAVRQSYLLRLDRYAFSPEDVTNKPSSDRNKKAWTCE